jgi:LPS O-antigen subunit length determinant protein (WzzB/FepE family)
VKAPFYNCENIPVFMPETSTAVAQQGDELDLIKLLERLFSFLRNYGKLMAVCAMLGLLAGYTWYKLSPRRYESTLLLHSASLTNTEQINIVDNWNALLKDGAYTVLGERLHCNPELLRKLSKISAAEIQKLYIPNNPNGFEVKVLVKDNRILDSLSDAIVYGFGNSDYMKAKLESRKANLASLIEEVQAEMQQLDSTRNSMGTGNSHSAVILDVSGMNSQMMGLNEKLLYYRDELKFAGAVQVLHKFERFEKPVSPKLFKLGVLGFAAGGVLGYLLALYSWVSKQIKRRALV